MKSQDEAQPKLAESMLVLLVRGFLTFLIFQFPHCSLSGEQLYDPVWEADGRFKQCGFQVMALICDVIAANRRLFHLHCH